MKANIKIALLVVLVLFLALTACTRLATTKSPATAATATGEAPFPFTTQGVANFGTQTAVAKTPQVVVATNTPEVVVQQGNNTPQAPAANPTAAPATNTKAPEAPAAAVNTPVVTRPSTYVLQKGEWPICIARRYNLDIPSFFALNGFTMDSKPAAGVTLRIPSGGSWNPNYGNRAYNSHPTTYTVNSGDTINTIACRYGDVTPDAILAVNGLSSASDVKAGSTLKIP